jgi:hypothetical protein
MSFMVYRVGGRRETRSAGSQVWSLDGSKSPVRVRNPLMAAPGCSVPTHPPASANFTGLVSFAAWE